jgi:hypothetical protein
MQDSRRSEICGKPTAYLHPLVLGIHRTDENLTLRNLHDNPTTDIKPKIPQPSPGNGNLGTSILQPISGNL